MGTKRTLVWVTLSLLCCWPRPVAAFVQEDLDRLLKTNECPKCDLSGASFAGKDLAKAKLPGADLRGADLTNASLSMADLAGANLSGANLSGTVFDAADLFHADLSGANIDGARFDGAYLAEATLDIDGQKGVQTGAVPELLPASVSSTQGLEEKGITPEEAPQVPDSSPEKAADAPQLKGRAEEMGAEVSADVEAAVPAGPHNEALSVPDPVAETAPGTVSPSEPMPATEATRIEELLKQAKKSGFCIECDFSRAMLNGVSMKGLNLERADFSEAQLVQVSFKDADLRGTIFRGANLKGAMFKGADLYLADFTGADLSGADFRGALLGGEVLGDANVDGALFDQPKPL